jgi:hormone-sensitive lipase
MLPYMNEKPKNTIFNDHEYMNIENIEVIALD